MSISPVDMQVMITKTTEIASKHSAELHKAAADQQKVNQQENTRQEEQTKKVHDRNTAAMKSTIAPYGIELHCITDKELVEILTSNTREGIMSIFEK